MFVGETVTLPLVTAPGEGSPPRRRKIARPGDLQEILRCERNGQCGRFRFDRVRMQDLCKYSERIISGVIKAAWIVEFFEACLEDSVLEERTGSGCHESTCVVREWFFGER